MEASTNLVEVTPTFIQYISRRVDKWQRLQKSAPSNLSYDILPRPSVDLCCTLAASRHQCALSDDLWLTYASLTQDASLRRHRHEQIPMIA